MPTLHGPTLLQRRLGSELRRLREATGLTISQAAKKLFFSRSKLSRLEAGLVSASLEDVGHMLDFYRVTGYQRDTLMRLARAAQTKEAWWYAYTDVTNIWTYLSFEDAAKEIRSFEALVVPGLLQIEEYARTTIPIFIPGLHFDEIDRHVEVRMTRQRRLEDPNPLQLWSILDEAVLYRYIGHRRIMRKQLDHLINAAQMPNVTLQVLPFRAGAHVGMNGMFTVLSYDDTDNPNIVYFEHTAGEVYLDSPEDTRQHMEEFESLGEVALSPRDSAAFLSEKAKDW